MATQTRADLDIFTGKATYVDFTPDEIAQQTADRAVIEKLESSQLTQTQADAKTRADGITHALSLGFTPAQAKAMFP